MCTVSAHQTQGAAEVALTPVVVHTAEFTQAPLGKLPGRLILAGLLDLKTGVNTSPNYGQNDAVLNREEETDFQYYSNTVHSDPTSASACSSSSLSTLVGLYTVNLRSFLWPAPGLVGCIAASIS